MCLSAVWTLWSLINRYLELRRLDETSVPNQALLVHAIHILVLLHDVLHHALAVMEILAIVVHTGACFCMAFWSSRRKVAVFNDLF